LDRKIAWHLSITGLVPHMRIDLEELKCNVIQLKSQTYTVRREREYFVLGKTPRHSMTSGLISPWHGGLGKCYGDAMG